MAGGVAIVAGRGELPRMLAEACAHDGRRYRVVVFDGVELDWLAGHPVIRAAFERPGRLFADLRRAGCDAVAFAGGMARPTLRLLRFDWTMLRLAPRLLPGIRSGDDATLRLIGRVFEAQGFRVVAPHEILPDLLAPEGVLGRVAPSAADRADAARAAAIVAALGAVDVGQAAVVARGICLGVESIQGTDALVDFVAATARQERRGVLLKAPKPGQDRRLDLPAIGPGTIARAAAAGLAGVVVEAGGVMVLGFGQTVADADKAGLFLWGRAP
jgi:DUF1009 family protein